MHSHGRTASWLRIDLNLAVVVGHNPVHDREAQPAAFDEPAVKRLEEAVELCGGNSHAFVTNGYHHAVRAGCALQQEPAAVRHGAQTVCGQIPHDLLDL